MHEAFSLYKPVTELSTNRQEEHTWSRTQYKRANVSTEHADWQFTCSISFEKFRFHVESTSALNEPKQVLSQYYLYYL
jgi:hypothetical protein